ncbi:MAG: SMP-30/gluconolactonase/LRE family protein [Cyclobacteriaceae bacterium]|nr:SMP-30/gluconolactonase/LRE family protein [Cyclobacteriaceae bacterium]MDH4296225.1 SMP-30/gluconolactonase/LRE family protein [Cyclobacteriaceae bacterium]
MKYITASALLIAAFSCTQKEVKTIGTIERIDPALDAIVNTNAKVEVIADGFNWSEGPLWIEDQQMLIFSDVPENIVYKWSAAGGKEVYLTTSGYTGSNSPYSGEEGSNGLTLNNEGKLVLCQHGDRRVSLMDAPINAPRPSFITISDNFEGKKLNSPNDAVFNKKGDLFFTDPPYGLPRQAESTIKEIPFNGVYRASGGRTSLLTDSVTRPNGIAFLPGEKTLLVANSDPEKALWYAFDLSENDSIINARIFHDAREAAKSEPGLPDGLKVDKNGNVFASGPGGVWIFNQYGKLLGKIRITENVSNCGFSTDEKTLYITADMYLVRVKLRD